MYPDSLKVATSTFAATTVFSHESVEQLILNVVTAFVTALVHSFFAKRKNK